MLHVPVGSVLTRVFYEVATWHGYGDRFNDHVEAVTAALDQWAAYDSDLGINPPAITERWEMRTPEGLTQDVPIQTTTIAPHLTTEVIGTEARREVRERIRESQQALAAAGA